MSPLSFFLRKSWHINIFAIVTGLISGVGNAAALAIINTALTSGAFRSSGLIWGFVLLGLTTLIARFISEVLLIRLSQSAIYDLRMHLCRQILRAPLRQLEVIGAPKLLAALTDDVGAIVGAFLSVPGLCTNVATVIVFLIYLGQLSWVALVTVIGFVVMGIVTYQLMEGRAVYALEQARHDQNSLFDHFRSITEGIKELKLHQPRRISFLTELLEPTARAFQQHNRLGMSIYAVAGTWVQTLLLLCTGLIVFVLPLLPSITPQIVISSTFTFVYLTAPLIGIVATLPNFGRAGVATRNLQSLGLSLDTGVEAEAAPVSPAATWRRLDLKGVTHIYQRGKADGTFQLGPIDLTFCPGKLVFLIGGNGSGKTTLTKVLTGLYAPEAGEILLDGQPVTEATRESYRQLFSAVLSDFYLFDRLLGIVSADLHDQTQCYLKQLQIEDKLTIEDGVLSTTALSQGQRKRLALLTAYLEDRSFYIFDEWAADQDPVFRDIFYTQLLPELQGRGKMVLAITHDDRYFHIADQIIKLDYGQLVSPQHIDASSRASELVNHPNLV